MLNHSISITSALALSPAFALSARASILSRWSMRRVIAQQIIVVCIAFTASVNILLHSSRSAFISFVSSACNRIHTSTYKWCPRPESAVVTLTRIHRDRLQLTSAIKNNSVLILEQRSTRCSPCRCRVLGPLLVVASHLFGGSVPRDRQTA